MREPAANVLRFHQKRADAAGRADEEEVSRPAYNSDMIDITVNGETTPLDRPEPLADLLGRLGMDPVRIAVEVNGEVVPRLRHAEAVVRPGDRIEIVTLVGGGQDPAPPVDKPLVVGKFTFKSRLITGTGKYATFELMRDCLDASGCEVTTVAVRRERLVDKAGRNILDYLDLKKFTILPNTAGCFSAEDAMRHARLARELLGNLGNPGADWVKLECLGDAKTLLPDPIATLQATKTLVKEGFQVLVYTSDDPILALRLKDAGATSVMPAGSPIGSGQGILNANNLPHHPRVSEGGGSGVPRHCRRRRRHGQRRRLRHGTGMRRSAAQHRDRRSPRSVADGVGDATCLRGWPLGVAIRTDSEEAVRDRVEPDGRPHRAGE